MRRFHLPIQDPCHENWDAMSRDGESQRFCEVCTKHVHDLSSMTERRARAVIAEKSQSLEGRVCVRYTYDRDGNIKFAPETIGAPSSLWRMTLAAAGMTVALLTGCTDTTPDEIEKDRCVYEVGPWTFTAARGQGSCPAIEVPAPEPDEVVELGEIAIDPPPEPEPVRELMGDVAGPEPEPIREVKGDIAAPPPEPVHAVKGKLKIAPPPEPDLDEVVMGEPMPENLDAPCDPPAKSDGPRRL